MGETNEEKKPTSELDPEKSRGAFPLLWQTLLPFLGLLTSDEGRDCDTVLASGKRDRAKLSSGDTWLGVCCLAGYWDKGYYFFLDMVCVLCIFKQFKIQLGKHDFKNMKSLYRT